MWWRGVVACCGGLISLSGWILLVMFHIYKYNTYTYTPRLEHVQEGGQVVQTSSQ